MSTKKLLTALALATSITAASAQEFNSESEDFAFRLSQYDKELFAAVYSEKVCPQYRIKFNKSFFGPEPFAHWSTDRRKEFVERVMWETRRKIDATVQQIGQEAYCLGYIEFVMSMHDSSKPMPIIVGGK